MAEWRPFAGVTRSNTSMPSMREGIKTRISRREPKSSSRAECSKGLRTRVEQESILASEEKRRKPTR